MNSTLVPARNKSVGADLVGLVFERVLAVPHEIREAFPAGCPGGTVSTILETARAVNPTQDPAYSSWLIYRWCEGKMTLADMKEAGSTLVEYSRHVSKLPLEGHSVFDMASLGQMRALMSMTMEVGENQTVRSFPLSEASVS
jgi:hypothetical protein